MEDDSEKTGEKIEGGSIFDNYRNMDSHEELDKEIAAKTPQPYTVNPNDSAGTQHIKNMMNKNAQNKPKPGSAFQPSAKPKVTPRINRPVVKKAAAKRNKKADKFGKIPGVNRINPPKPRKL